MRVLRGSVIAGLESVEVYFRRKHGWAVENYIVLDDRHRPIPRHSKDRDRRIWISLRHIKNIASSFVARIRTGHVLRITDGSHQAAKAWIKARPIRRRLLRGKRKRL